MVKPSPHDMRPYTLKSIRDGLDHARRKHPRAQLSTLDHFVKLLHEAFENHDKSAMSASQVFAVGVTVAAQAIRLVEEGDPKHRYASYLREGPLFAGDPTHKP